MARCACGTTISNDTCACALAAADGVTLTGTGNVGDPYTVGIDVDPADGNTLATSGDGVFTSGILVATSATRPGIAPAAGVRVLLYETDTDLVWAWDGAEWKRLAPKGLLGSAERTTDFENATTTFDAIVTTGSVHVPDGTRPLEVVVSWPGVHNTDGSAALGIKRSLADGSSEVLLDFWTASGDDTSPVAGAGGSGGSYVAYEFSGLPEDDYKWTFVGRSVAGPGGTTHVTADVGRPATITVKEV